MTGFQVFLCVLAGIVGLFVIVLSIPLKVSVAAGDKIHVSVKYLFIKLDILPTDPNKKKKPKKPKSEKPQKEPKAAADRPKEKKSNPIIDMVKANGYDGMMAVISNLGRVLGIYGGKIFKSIVFNEIDLYICVGTGDSAQTAIKYGKTCQQVYPVFGFICSNNLVHKYDVMVEPDFLANKTKGEFFVEMNITLRKIINATFAMVFRLIFSVVLKFVSGGLKKKADEQPSDITVKQNSAN